MSLIYACVRETIIDLLIVGCNALELGRSSEECITFIARVEE
jgi:hypothetical protein